MTAGGFPGTQGTPPAYGPEKGWSTDGRRGGVLMARGGGGGVLMAEGVEY